MYLTASLFPGEAGETSDSEGQNGVEGINLSFPAKELLCQETSPPIP